MTHGAPAAKSRRMTDRTRPAAKASRASTITVGWALTALTLLVLCVGVAIVRLASSDSRPVEPDPGITMLDVEPAAPDKNEESGAIVLRPIESDDENAASPRAQMVLKPRRDSTLR